MDPISLAILAALGVGGGYLAYEKFFAKKAAPPQLQSLRSTDAAGKPVQVVVPVAPATAPAPVSGQAATPLHPNNAGTGASYAPAPVVAKVSSPSSPQGTVVTLAPMVITPTGAATLSITTPQDIQNALNTLGMASPPLTVDGKIGPLSVTAIKKFQTSQGLTVDGIAGPQTKTALQSALAVLAGTNSTVGQAATNAAAASGGAGFGIGVIIPSQYPHSYDASSEYGADIGRGHHRHKKHKKPPEDEGGDADAGLELVGTVPRMVEPPGFGAARGGFAPRADFARSQAAREGLAGNFVQRGFVRGAAWWQTGLPGHGADIVNIVDVQHALNLLGASPHLDENNVLDPPTVAAVRAFQIVHGLVSDGVPGPKTRWALAIALNPASVDAASPPDDSADAAGELGTHSVGFG